MTATFPVVWLDGTLEEPKTWLTLFILLVVSMILFPLAVASLTSTESFLTCKIPTVPLVACTSPSACTLNTAFFRFVLAGHILRDVLHIRQEAVLLGQRVIPRLCAAQQTARNEHRVAGSGQQHGVALVAQHHTNVAHALLTARTAGHLIRRDQKV